MQHRREKELPVSRCTEHDAILSRLTEDHRIHIIQPSPDGSRTSGTIRLLPDKRGMILHTATISRLTRDRQSRSNYIQINSESSSAVQLYPDQSKIIKNASPDIQTSPRSSGVGHPYPNFFRIIY